MYKHDSLTYQIYLYNIYLFSHKLTAILIPISQKVQTNEAIITRALC